MSEIPLVDASILVAPKRVPCGTHLNALLELGVDPGARPSASLVLCHDARGLTVVLNCSSVEVE